MIEAKDSYDTHAQAWIERLHSGSNLAHSMLEKPAMLVRTPDLTDKRVLALGCGSAEEFAIFLARHARAADLVGIDISAELLECARQRFPESAFLCRSIDHLGDFDDASFDFIYSSLTLHYLPGWLPLLQEAHRILSPGGSMLFSTHHPVKWGAQVQRGETADTFRMGYIRPKQSAPVVHGDYLGTRHIEDNWFNGSMPVSYYHRPLSAIMADVLASGLQIREFAEPAPVAGTAALHPHFHAIHSRIPLFMIFDLVKP